MGDKRGATKKLLVGLTLLGSAFVFSACGGSGGGGAQGGGGSGEPVNFGTVDWPEAIAKTNVSATIVEALGHETEIQQLGVPVIFKGLEQGDLDVFVEAWFPTMDTNMKQVEPGSVESVTTNLPEATFSVAVNREACDAGVESHEDLDQYKEEFEGKIYGIEPGNDGNKVVMDMIKNDTYGLGDWELVESSTNGMLSEVDRHIKDGEWVAFTGWEPHWMGQKYDMCLLEDPEMAWGGPSHVETLVTADFGEDTPELYQFFEQMKVDKEIQGNWIDMIDNSGKEPEEVATEWLQDNPKVTDKWLSGVESSDGTPGPEALASHLEEQAGK
ncbi:MAG: glycine/betaine ABC transporter substrate-binding protein [Actinomycetota bacterium]|nr:glycine/betaine ABC transporter substrate-binding protein [Actinomycetota bacterium]MDP9484745.1 glycine/betaine ABC transporter substrate-binding protein [Actinomycetota bacterium]